MWAIFTADKRDSTVSATTILFVCFSATMHGSICWIYALWRLNIQDNQFNIRIEKLGPLWCKITFVLLVTLFRCSNFLNWLLFYAFFLFIYGTFQTQYSDFLELNVKYNERVDVIRHAKICRKMCTILIKISEKKTY